MTDSSRTIRCLALAVSLLTLLLPCSAQAQNAEDDQVRVVNHEYPIKAAFLLHFTTFINWPDGTLDDKSIEIGFLGTDPFGKALKTIEGKMVQGRKIVVKRSKSVKDLKSCAVIFISRSEKKRLKEIFAEIGNKPILTVSDIEGFASKWGVVNFSVSGNRVRFKFNTAAAKRARLRVSSRLLRVATIVEDAHKPIVGQ